MEPATFHDWSILNALYQYFRRPELLACDVGVDLDTIADGARTGRAECELIAETVDHNKIIQAARLTYPRFPAPFNPMNDGVEVRKALTARYSDSSTAVPLARVLVHPAMLCDLESPASIWLRVVQEAPKFGVEDELRRVAVGEDSDPYSHVVAIHANTETPPNMVFSWRTPEGQPFADNRWFLIRREYVPENYESREVANIVRGDGRLQLSPGVLSAQFFEQVCDERIDAVVAEHGLRTIRKLGFAPKCRILCPVATGYVPVAPLLQALRSDPSVVSAEPHLIDSMDHR